jgi:hypothetical protein
VAAAPAEVEPVEAAPVAAAPDPSPQSFSALLGSPTPEPAASQPDDTPAAAVAPTSTVVAVPLAAADHADSALRPLPRRRRFGGRDPFARSMTRRERLLTRLCMTLAISLALALIVMRLPLGARPELGASGVAATSSTTFTTTNAFTDAIRVQTRADLEAVITTAERFHPIWKSYARATPDLLNGALPQFGFVTRTQVSQRVGEISLAGSAAELVLAEYAGPGQCAFARVIDRHPAETVGPTGGSCRASTPPQFGWTALNPEG